LWVSPWQAVAGCRLAQALTQYCVGANYGWLLAEGLFLHKLLVLAAFSGERCLPAFLLLGWGEPIIPLRPPFVPTCVPPLSPRASPLCPIVRPPFVPSCVPPLSHRASPLWVSLSAPLHRLARSTLTLIPLLGVHEVAFAVLGEGQGGGTLRLVR
ncbi:GIPR protein, partial [Urocolius indicus]|nr:GIPR protein [Urocolius indicus]